MMTSAKSAQRCKHKLPYKFQFPLTKRQPKANLKYVDHTTATTETEESDTHITSSMFHEAISSYDAAQWRTAMEKEFNSLIYNNTFKLIPLPASHKLIQTRWLYKIKCKADGSINCFKARWVAKGYL